MSISNFPLCSLALGLMLAAGCSKTAPDTTPPEPVLAMNEPEPAPAATPEQEPLPEPAAAAVEEPPPAPPPLSDGEIVAIVKAVNEEEVEHAKLARSKAKHRQVKEFASMMAKTYAAANKRENALVKRSTLIRIDNESSRKIEEEAKLRAETLKNTAKGAAFDRAYMEAEVQMLTMVLDMLTNRMLPAAQNSDLKTELEAMRGSIDAHLIRAREIQEALNQPSA